LLYQIVNAIRIKRFRRLMGRISSLESTIQGCSDAELKEKTPYFRQRLRRGASLSAILPEAFAVVREVARRIIGLRPYDVQLAGGIAIHRGMIAEMQTGEGKTLVATMPAYLNALTGKGVHIITVNDYLARRDAEWMGPIYQFLGLRVACVSHGITDQERHDAYAASITYGTNKEFAFDYLRDRLRIEAATREAGKGLFERSLGSLGAGIQRPHYYAIVDEVDSILIDEARVPLIIADAPKRESPHAPAIRLADRVAETLVRGVHFGVDARKKDVFLTDDGRSVLRERQARAEASIPINRPLELLVEQALRARLFFTRDREYLIGDGKAIIVDEFTGRKLPDRSWNTGLHQAIQAKERLDITSENRTLAQVTFQRYFKLYDKLSGMTGTARSSRREFWKVYKLKVVTIPTDRPLRRKMLPDRIFRSRRVKNEAVADRVAQMTDLGRPVLIGTRSVKRSEEVGKILSRRGIAHVILNARQDAQEAAIIAQAGHPRTVTIATNMAGRGVDIILGDGVAQAGGLHVIGTERHDARRIDLQLGGRSGRQGDLGSFEFFLSFEDEILRTWKRALAVWLRRDADTWKAKLLPKPILRTLFVIAQHAAERRHLNVRMLLMEHDKWLEESKGNLGVPVWG